MEYVNKIKKHLSPELMLCFKNLGVSETATRLGIQPSLIVGWLDGLEIPEVYQAQLLELSDEVTRRLEAAEEDYSGPVKKKKSRWAKYEDNYLVRNWGKMTPEEIGRNLKRGSSGCVARMRHLTGSSSPVAAVSGYTQSSLARITGYTQRIIREAVKSLGIREDIARPADTATPGGLNHDNRQWYISEENAKRIMNWVSERDSDLYDKACRWGNASDHCVACGSEEEEHYSKDMCKNCYAKHRRRYRRGEPSILNGQLEAPHG